MSTRGHIQDQTECQVLNLCKLSVDLATTLDRWSTFAGKAAFAPRIQAVFDWLMGALVRIRETCGYRCWCGKSWRVWESRLGKAFHWSDEGRKGLRTCGYSRRPTYTLSPRCSINSNGGQFAWRVFPRRCRTCAQRDWVGRAWVRRAHGPDRRRAIPRCLAELG